MQRCEIRGQGLNQPIILPSRCSKSYSADANAVGFSKSRMNFNKDGTAKMQKLSVKTFGILYRHALSLPISNAEGVCILLAHSIIGVTPQLI